MRPPREIDRVRQLELGTPHSAVDANGREAPTHPMEHATWSKQGCVCGARDTRDGVLIVGALSENNENAMPDGLC